MASLRSRRIVAAAALAAAVAAGPARAQPDAGPQAPGLQRDVVFPDYPAIAQSSALAPRLLGPRDYRELQARLAASGERLREQFFDLAGERFAFYLPRRKPPAGYALLVFVPPWPQLGIPQGWAPVFDRYGVIFVTAARSGNEESVHRRRIPLALIAEANVAARYELDRTRIYVGGFSGGSRVAERLALEFPDLFTGAILNAGADPIGEAETPVPDAARLARVQAATRLVLVTGERDEAGVGADATARTSFRAWCVAHVRQITMLGAGHQAATPAALEEALKALAEPREDAGALARSQRCRADLAARLAADKARLAGLRSPAEIAAERDRLEARYGWLASDAPP